MGASSGMIHSVIVDQIEKELISQVLTSCGVQTKAATQLGINRNTLHKKIKDYQLDEIFGKSLGGSLQHRVQTAEKPFSPIHPNLSFYLVAPAPEDTPGVARFSRSITAFSTFIVPSAQSSSVPLLQDPGYHQAIPDGIPLANLGAPSTVNKSLEDE